MRVSLPNIPVGCLLDVVGEDSLSDILGDYWLDTAGEGLNVLYTWRLLG